MYKLSKKTHHVIPSPKSGWSVVRGGSKRVSRNFDNKKSAIDWGIKVSNNQKTELIIHKKNGSVDRERNQNGKIKGTL